MKRQKRYKLVVFILIAAILIEYAGSTPPLTFAQEPMVTIDIWENDRVELALDETESENGLDICEEYVLSENGTAYFVAITVNGDILRYEVDIVNQKILEKKALLYEEEGGTLEDYSLLSFGGKNGTYWLQMGAQDGAKWRRWILLLDENWELQKKFGWDGTTDEGVQWCGDVYLSLNNSNIVNTITYERTVFQPMVPSNYVKKVLYCGGKFLVREAPDVNSDEGSVYSLRDATDTSLEKVEFGDMIIESIQAVEGGYEMLCSWNGQVVVLHVDPSLSLKDSIVLHEAGYASRVITMPGYHLVRWTHNMQAYHAIYDEKWNLLTHTTMAYGDLIYNNIQNFNLDGKPHVLTATSWRNEIYYYLSDEIDFGILDDPLENIIVSPQVETDSVGYVVQDGNSSAEYVGTLEPVREEVYSTILVGESRYLMVSDVDKTVMKYFRMHPDVTQEPTGSMEPTPTPIPAASAELMPEPTSTVSVELTPEPMSTPIPTASVEPTPTPIPTESVEPTPTPIPTASAEPTMEPTPTSPTEAMEEPTLDATPKASIAPNLSKPTSLKPALPNLKRIKISKMTQKGKKVKVLWKPSEGILSGYELQYSTKKNFQKKATKTLHLSKKKTSKAFRIRKKRKKYYIRIRVYCDVRMDGVKIRLYSKWSKVRKVN